MSFYLYRTNGGEVVAMSIDSFAPAPSEFSEIENPTEVDGPGLDPKKIIDGTDHRNATAGELASFQGFEDADEMAKGKTSAKSYLDNGKKEALLLRAFAEVVLGEINLIRANFVVPMTPRTKAQLITEIKNKVDGLS